MNKVYLDTNVVLDAFLPDRPSADASARILFLGEKEKVRCYMSSLTVANVAYVLKKNQGKGYAMDTIRELFRKHFVLSVSDMCVWEALRSDCPDFEDALQIACADYGNCDCIVTTNVKHFRGCAPLPVFTPEEFLEGCRAAATKKRQSAD